MRKRNFNMLLILFVVILLFGLGYAYLTTTLSINGTTDIDSNTWNVYCDNVEVTEGSVTGSQVIQAPTISTNKTSVSFHIRLKEPGEFYEFTVDAKNDGSIDAMIDTITKTVNNGTTIPSYINYTVTYEDDLEIVSNQKLSANSSETYKIRVEYRTDIEPENLPNTAQSLSLTFGVTNVQANSSAIRVRNYRYWRMTNASYQIGDSIPPLYHNSGASNGKGCYDDIDNMLGQTFIRYTYDDNEFITDQVVGVNFYRDKDVLYLYPGSEQYESNVEALKEYFGEDNCGPYSTTGYHCFIDRIGGYTPHIMIYPNGRIDAQAYCLECAIGVTGVSNCSVVHTTECWG